MLRISGEHGYEYRGYNAGCIVTRTGLMELVARVISEDFEAKEWTCYDAALLEKLAEMIRGTPPPTPLERSAPELFAACKAVRGTLTCPVWRSAGDGEEYLSCPGCGGTSRGGPIEHEADCVAKLVEDAIAKATAG